MTAPCFSKKSIISYDKINQISSNFTPVFARFLWAFYQSFLNDKGHYPSQQPVHYFRPLAKSNPNFRQSNFRKFQHSFDDDNPHHQLFHLKSDSKKKLIYRKPRKILQQSKMILDEDMAPTTIARLPLFVDGLGPVVKCFLWASIGLFFMSRATHSNSFFIPLQTHVSSSQIMV